MKVGKKTEAEYIEEKVKDKNKDEAGSGDLWKERWVADREERFEPKFIELFNKHIEERGIAVGKDYKDAAYKLVVWTTITESGFNIGIAKRPAGINVEYWLYDTSTYEVVAKAEMKKLRGTDGMGFDFDVAKRLEEGYAKGGKYFAKHLKKKVIKKDKK
jgi:hypothetical protein